MDGFTAMAQAASMRPRVFPAEDQLGSAGPRLKAVASMRPRVFPAEDARSLTYAAARFSRFNEAAGIPRGRRRQSLSGRGSRPGFNEAAGIPRGRHPLRRRRRCHHYLASMRPRVFPAEDGAGAAGAAAEVEASMRPRVFPAEDRRASSWRASSTPGFNEAAGIPRGRPPPRTRKRRRPGASMRPRVFPAEDAPGARRCRTGGRGFNEAAGIPRGRPNST